MASCAACRRDLSICGGIQHPKIIQYAKDNPGDLTYLLDKFSFIRGGWHSQDCSFIAEESDKKERCKQCKSVRSNIRASHFPRLFPAAAEEAAEEAQLEEEVAPSGPAESSSVRIHDQIFSDRAALQRRVNELVASVGGGDLSANDELALAAKVLKACDEYIVHLEGGKVLVFCNGGGCEEIFVKNGPCKRQRDVQTMHWQGL